MPLARIETRPTLRQPNSINSQQPAILTEVRELRVYVFNFSIGLHFTLMATGEVNSLQEFSIKRVATGNSFSKVYEICSGITDWNFIFQDRNDLRIKR